MTIDLLAFGAHPDDAELGAAGALIRAARAGSSTGIVTLTRGEMGTRGDPASRAAEFDAAAAAMGLAHHAMLELPDGRLECDAASRETVVRVLRELRPAVVLAPYWEDRHPDHAAASRIVQEAAFLAGLARFDTGQPPHRPGQVVYYMAAWEFEPSFVVDISEHFERKQAVLRCYASQLFNPDSRSAEPRTYISSEHYWELLAARAAHYGRLIGTVYAEPFRIRGLVELSDLVAAFGGRTL
jgi:bacillithiol biosynthesis deacetylase BshB1